MVKLRPGHYLIFIICFIVVSAGCGKGGYYQGGDRIPIGFWHWGPHREFSQEEIKLLDAINAQHIFEFRGRISRSGEEFSLEERGGIAESPKHISKYAVFRVDPKILSHVWEESDEFAEFIAARYKTLKNYKGLQLDCDTPTSKIGKYAGLIRLIREKVPEKTEISATMLLDWLNSSELEDLMQEADLVIPQFYTAVLPETPEPEHLVFGGDLETAVRKLNSFNRPYMIGLPCFRRTAVFGGDGKLQVASSRLSAAEAFYSGGILKEHRKTGDENILRILMPDGRSALIGRPRIIGISSRVQKVKALASENCKGICFYRLPDTDTSDVVSLKRISAACAAEDLKYDISGILKRTGENLTLILVNKGDEDFIDYSSPVSIKLMSEKGILKPVNSVPGTVPWRIETVYNGESSSLKRSNGVVITCPFILSGTENVIGDFTLKDSKIPDSDIKAKLLIDKFQWNIEVTHEK